MAFETRKEDVIHTESAITDVSTAALIEQVKLLPFVISRPVGSQQVQKFLKRGFLEAVSLAEAVPHPFSKKDRYNNDAVTVTATKASVIPKLTVEADRFTDLSADQLATEAGAAHARKLDKDIKDLFPGFTNEVGGSANLTNDKLLEAAYLVRKGNADNGVLIFAGDYEQIYNLELDTESNEASVYANPQLPLILNGYNGQNGIVGRFMGINVVATDGMAVDGNNNHTGLLFNPAKALCGIYDDAPTIWINQKGSEGYYWEIAGHMFSGVAMYHAEAGCKVVSDIAALNA